MGTKKVLEKAFTSIEAEEAWLNELAAAGWLLIQYSDEEFGATTYTFEQQELAKNGHYKMDFVRFRNREEFEDYKELMAESGWQLLAENEYFNKLILFSFEKKALFSDEQSKLQREARKRQSAVKLALSSFAFGAIAKVIYWQFNYGVVMAIGLVGFVNALYYTFNACKLTFHIRKGKVV